MCPEKQGNYICLPRYVAEEGAVHPSPVRGSPSGLAHYIHLITLTTPTYFQSQRALATVRSPPPLEKPPYILSSPWNTVNTCAAGAAANLAVLAQHCSPFRNTYLARWQLPSPSTLRQSRGAGCVYTDLEFQVKIPERDPHDPFLRVVRFRRHRVIPSNNTYLLCGSTSPSILRFGALASTGDGSSASTPCRMVYSSRTASANSDPKRTNRPREEELLERLGVHSYERSKCRMCPYWSADRPLLPYMLIGRAKLWELCYYLITLCSIKLLYAYIKFLCYTSIYVNIIIHGIYDWIYCCYSYTYACQY